MTEREREREREKDREREEDKERERQRNECLQSQKKSSLVSQKPPDDTHLDETRERIIGTSDSECLAEGILCFFFFWLGMWYWLFSCSTYVFCVFLFWWNFFPRILVWVIFFICKLYRLCFYHTIRIIE